MSDVGVALYESGWNDTGGGYWWHPKVDSGNKRFNMDQAIVKELERRQSMVDAHSAVLDDIRNLFGLKCEHGAMVKQLAPMAKLWNNPKMVLDIAGGKSEESPPICPDCDVPMTNWSGQTPGRLFQCEACGRSVDIGRKVVSINGERVIPKADRQLIEKAEKVAEQQEAPPKQRSPEVPILMHIRSLEKELEAVKEVIGRDRADVVSHEQSIGHLANIVRVLADEYGSRKGLKLEPLQEKFLEEWKV